MQIDPEYPDVERFNEIAKFDGRISQENCAEIDDLYVVAPSGQMPMKHLEPDWEVFIERRDGYITGGSEKGKVDIAAIAKVEERRSVNEQQVAGQRR